MTTYARMDLCNICPIGMMNVIRTNSKRGRTRNSARRFAFDCARASAALSGMPSAVVRPGLFACASRFVSSVIVAMTELSPGQNDGAEQAAPPKSCYCASQALKRSFSSASLSTQNSKLLTSALPRLASAVGMCDAISVLPSEYRPTIAPDDLRAGP